MIKAKAVVLNRAEGFIEDLQMLVIHSSAYEDVWKEVNNTLLDWSETVAGGYDKVDFTVVYEDGETYAGRYDLEHYSKEMPSLANHMRSLVGCWAGIIQPEWTKAPGQSHHWGNMKANFQKEGIMQEAHDFLAQYEIAIW